MELLTKEEGLQYLQDALGIPISEVPNFSEKSVSAETKLSFLETLLRAFLAREPFQSIYLMSDEIINRRRPTWDEIKRDLLLGRGGLCYWQNAFMYALLTSLGLNAGMTYSTFNLNINSPDNHLIVLIHDLVAPESLHLVDAGIGYYIPHVVFLDFTKESQEYTDSFLTYKFCKESENKFYMMKKVPADTPSSISNGAENDETNQHYTWSWVHFFNPLISLKKLEPFFPCFDNIFTDITKLSAHTSPRAMCWPNGRFLALVNSKLIQENEDGKLTKTSIIEPIFIANPLLPNQNNNAHSKARQNGVSSIVHVNPQDTANKTTEEIPSVNTKNEPAKHTEDQNKQNIPDLETLVQAYEKYFPMLPTPMVQAALRNWTLTGSMFPIPPHMS
uniref:arylamine N-acetyltransferase n=1 Tax=Arion vulgaris TaxID=1028688 RepID=A0A0B7B6P5_9EUPU